MNWQPIDTAPVDTNVLICGEDLYGVHVITGGIKYKLGGWYVLGCGGYECETEIEPTHWAPFPYFPKGGE